MVCTFIMDGQEHQGNLMIEKRQPFLEGFHDTYEILVQMMQVRPTYSKIDDLTLYFEVFGFVIRRPKIIIPGMKVTPEPKTFELKINRSKLNSDPDSAYVLQTVESWYDRAKQQRLKNEVANMTNRNPNKKEEYSKINQ